MSNLVEQITNSIESVAQTTLGADYKLLSYKWDVSKNGTTQNKKRFGCIPQSITKNAPTLIRYIDVQQIFQFIIHEPYTTKDGNDRVITEKVNFVYDQMDAVLEALYNRKAGLPSIVTLIDLDGIQVPNIDEANKTITLRMDLNVRYRKLIS